MAQVLIHAKLDEDGRRAVLYDGVILFDAPSPATRALADFARELVLNAFAPLDPLLAQFDLSLERFVAIAGKLKTTFTNHAKTKQLMQLILAERGADPEATYFDVPRLRIVTAQGYLTAGVGYAYKPHRDTWYAGPQSQLNWWSSLFDLEPSQALVFYPGYFARAFPNTSEGFDYDEWQRVGRTTAVTQISRDDRKHPLPLAELHDRDELRLVTTADQCLQFSAAHLHGTAPNTSQQTRFSIDFRTVHIGDMQAGRGAANIDSRSRGSTINDFIRVADLQPYMPSVAPGVRMSSRPVR